LARVLWTSGVTEPLAPSTWYNIQSYTRKMIPVSSLSLSTNSDSDKNIPSCYRLGVAVTHGRSPFLTAGPTIFFDHLETLEPIYTNTVHWVTPGSEMTPWGTLSPTCGCTSVAYYGTVLFFIFARCPARKMRLHRFLTAHATTVTGSQ